MRQLPAALPLMAVNDRLRQQLRMAPDPELPVELSEVQRQLSEWSGRTGRQPSDITSVDAVSGGDWDEEPVCTG